MFKTYKKIFYFFNPKWQFPDQKYNLILFLCTFTNFYSAPTLAEVIVNQNVVTEPLIIEGVTSGSVTALEIAQTENTATGYCDGFTNLQPNHVLTLDKYFSSLRLEVESNADTTIIVRSVAGTWCNDDVDNTNPAIEGAWQPGKYQIWVGNYQQAASNSYLLKITGQ